MPLNMISVGAKTLAATVSGLTLISPMAGGANASPVAGGVVAHAAPAVAGPNMGSLESTVALKKAAVVAPSLFAQGTKGSENTYGKFTEDMKGSPLSSSNTGGIFTSFTNGPTAEDARAADALAAQWRESGVPENANVISKNLNIGVPSYTPVQLDLHQGWNGQYVQVNVNNEQEAQLRLNIIKSAESKYGLPYIWGGNDPNVGLDCSGFTKWVYAQQGININRVVADIRPTIKPIAEKDAKPGDLVFVNGTTHIGIVLDAKKHTYWNEPHPGSFAQIGNYSYGSNVTFGTVINNTESPVGIDPNAVLNKVNNSNATTSIQVGDRNTKALENAGKPAPAPKAKAEAPKASPKPAKATPSAPAKPTPSKSSTPTKPSAPASTPRPRPSASSTTPATPKPSATSSKPAPKPSATPTAKPSATPSPKPSATPAPKPSASSTAPSATPSPSSSVSRSASPSASVSPTALPTVISSASPLSTPTE